MKYSSIIFDIDGTLWDSTSVCAESWNLAVEKLGLAPRSFVAEDIRSIMGMQHRQIYEKMFPDVSSEQRLAIARECYAQEIDLIRRKGATLYPGVAEGIAKLAKNFPLYLVSNCLVEYLETFLDWTGFRSYFKDQICHGTTGEGKAHNLGLLVERNGLRSTVYVGDTASDQEAATKAGIEYLHAEYGFGTPSRECVGFEHFRGLVDYLLIR